MAAIHYVLRFNNRTPLHPGWDWAARALEFQAPDPLIQRFFRGAPMRTPSTAQANAQPPAKRETEKETRKDSPEPIRYSPLGIEVVGT